MMSRNKNSTHYSATDIEKYRKGELSARDMHDLEQAALDDPFLADAIEGLTQHPALQQDLDDLHHRLDIKVNEASRRHKIRSIQSRITLAAALILLLGIGYTFFYHQTDSFAKAKASAKAASPQATPQAASQHASQAAPEPATIALNTPAPAAQRPQPETKTAADSMVFKSSLANNNKSTSAFRHPLPAAAAKPAGDLSNEYRSDDKAAASAYSNHASPPTSNQASPSTANQVSPSTSNQVTTTNQLSINKELDSTRVLPDSLTLAKLKATPLVYSGKVLDLQNHPLAGAFLALNGNSAYGFTTDNQGQFMISLHPHDSTRQLTVSMIGYDHASLALNTLSTDDQKGNIIRLRPSTGNLDEVVVVGYGMRRKATEVAAPSESNEKLDTLWTIAAPIIGRQAYLQYLGIAKKKLGLDSTITGTETISFIVSPSSPLSSFKIEQSISPAHDAGIIRLVTDGPAWHLLRGKKVRASVTVNF